MAEVFPERPPSIPLPPVVPNAPLSPQDERTWAMLAHLSVLINLITGFLGPVVALIIYMVYKDRSRYVAYHAMQSMVFQLICWIGGGTVAAILWTMGGILTVVLIGLCIFPLALIASLLPIAAIIYGIVGGIQTSQGLDFKYWMVGDWMRGTLMGR